MDYHLHHEGRDLGVLPLEELRRRRQSGELSGTEYVWREGMAEWQTYDGYIAEPSQEKSRAGWRSSYATIAYLAKKYDVAREQLEALDWQPLPAAWGWGTDLSLMPLEVAARTGPAATNVSPAETRYRRGDIDEALRRYKELAEATDVDARTLKFAQHRIAALELEKRLAAGEWIDLLPSGTNDPAWEISFGTVRRSSDGPLEVEAARNGHMLFSRARVGLAFEVRGEFEKLKSSTDDFQAGLVMGLPNFNNTDWYAFRMKRNRDEGDIASFSRGWTKTQIAKPVGLSTRNTFQFQFQNGEATATVNGKPVLQRSKLKGALRASESEFLVGLGAFNDMNETVVRYHKIQLRRLAPARPATEKEN